MPYLLGLLAALCCLLLPAAPAAAERRTALVIGNWEYQAIGRLANPESDAETVARALRAAGFGSVTVRTNLALGELRNAVRGFRDEAEHADVALLYYAGHGIEAAGINWLVPVDAKLARAEDLDYEAVKTDLVLQALEGARMRVLVLDACRDNPFAGTWRSGSRSVATRGLKRVEADDVLVLFAAAPGEVASDGVGGARNSPFATAFARRIVEAGLPVQNLGGRVRDDVISATGGKQRPYVSASITGEPFYFVPGAAAPSAASPASPAISEVERLWEREVKDSREPAVLEAFIRHYGQTFHGDLARARLAALSRELAAERIKPSSLPASRANPAPSSRHCARAPGGETYCASSVLPPQLGNSYGPEHLFDGRQQTAWVHGSGGVGIGAWVSVIFERRKLVEAIVILNGYAKNADIFGKNTSVRRAQLVFSDGQTRAVELARSMSRQTIAISPPVAAEWVQLRIDDVHRGSKYGDTAISELRVEAR